MSIFWTGNVLNSTVLVKYGKYEKGEGKSIIKEMGMGGGERY